MSNLTSNLWQDLQAGDVISLWDIMADLWITGDNFFSHMSNIQTAGLMVSLPDTMKSQMSIKPLDQETIFNSMLVFTEYFKLTTTSGTIKSLIESTKLSGHKLSGQEMHLLSIVLRNEMKGLNFLMIAGDRKHYWESGTSGYASEMLDKFPDAVEDLSDGHRCFAVGRYTATVFHLMRAMEVIVKILADKLGANIISEKTGEILCWGVLVGNMKPPIDKMKKGKKKDAWCKAHALLHSVNRSFRTETAHPKKTYTEEEAKVVVDSVKAFISELGELEI